MPEIRRRGLFGTAAAGLAALGLAGRAQIDAPVATGSSPTAEREPASFVGDVSGTKVSLPKLFAASEMEGGPANLLPPERRLGVAVVGLGHLTLGQILPGFGSARSVRLAALVSGAREKARAIAAQHGLSDGAIYDYGDFDRIADDPAIDIVYIVLPNAMRAEFTTRQQRRASTRCARSRWPFRSPTPSAWWRRAAMRGAG